MVDTPRDGKAWCDTVNDPLPASVKKAGMRKVLALGTCQADGSGFKPYDTPVEREVIAPTEPTGTYLWLGEK